MGFGLWSKGSKLVNYGPILNNSPICQFSILLQSHVHTFVRGVTDKWTGEIKTNPHDLGKPASDKPTYFAIGNNIVIEPG